MLMNVENKVKSLMGKQLFMIIQEEMKVKDRGYLKIYSLLNYSTFYQNLLKFYAFKDLYLFLTLKRKKVQ